MDLRIQVTLGFFPAVLGTDIGNPLVAETNDEMKGYFK